MECRSLRGNVDRNVYSQHAVRRNGGRSLRGNVDRNQNRVNMSSAGNRRRSLRGNVDRNDLMSDL